MRLIEHRVLCRNSHRLSIKPNTKATMPDIISVIRKRRSVRKFKDKPVEGSKLLRILEAGRWAPSGLNNQPWRFLVIQDKELRSKISEFTKYGRIITGAGSLVLVLMDTADSYNRDKDLMATGAVSQNMLLEACALGIGSCRLGEIVNQKARVQKLLGLDSDLELLAVIAFGYPACKPISCRKKLKSLIIYPHLKGKYNKGLYHEGQ